MARRKNNEEDAVLAALRRTQRTGRSFFPAANAINDTGQGEVLNNRVLPPEQNPAYQAAIAKGRPSMKDYVWLQSPNGGSMRVPASSVSKLNAAMPGSYVEPTGPLTPQQYGAAWSQGYGAPPPSFNPETRSLAVGGVERPVEQMTPGQRAYYGAPLGAKETTLQAAGNVITGKTGVPIANNQQYLANLRRFNFFGNLRRPPAVAQQYPNYYNLNPSPAPPPMRRYSDLF